MPANQRHQSLQSPASPTSQATAKYTNKDGSKFITVPKPFNASSSETSPAMAQTTKPNGQMPIVPPSANGIALNVNRKKQKRREKQAAKALAEEALKRRANGSRPAIGKGQIHDLEARFREHGIQDSYEGNGQFDPGEGDPYDTDGYSGSYDQEGSPTNGYPRHMSNAPRKSSKKKKKSKGDRSDNSDSSQHATNGSTHNHVSMPIPTLAPTNMPRGPGISKEKIWNTSSQEERERIKEFWLSLGEDERKSLVKVEKDAVLKKMKEQQKHSCSCTVCGRKRTAIEEELEVLYDAYYEELEQYANHQGDGIPPMLPPPQRFGRLSGLQPPHRLPRLPPGFNNQQPSRGRIVEQLGDDDEEEEDDEEEYSEQDGDEDDYSDEDEPEELPRSHAADFFNFGNSLTVQGGILTVADDLLKNDGKKFIEMMEQLAERRMAREEDAREQFANPNYGHPPNGGMHPHAHNHNHPPQQEEEEYEDDEEEDEDEYESGEEDYDEEEMDTMTEEQRMEEGRRMFQIFAARMFEQRVLTAYKEKVAKERQQKLLEELEEESRMDSQKKAKKAKDAQKKKEKLAQKKQLLADEKAKREAEKAAEESATRAAEDKKVEEQRQKAEEKRKKKDAQKKAEEEDKLRKEVEKQRRLKDQKDRQLGLERKQKEAKERERKEKEELRVREREAKEAKEREMKERKEKAEREKREKEARSKADREAKESQKREDLIAQKAAATAAHVATQAAKRLQAQVPIPVNLQPHPIASPHVQVATPAFPKAPTPIKLRRSSQQDSNSIPATPQTGSLSQNVSPVPSTPLQGSPGPVGLNGKNHTQPFLHHPQASSPIHSAIKGPPGIQSNPFNMPPIGMGFQPGMPLMAPGFGRMHHDPMFAHQPPVGSQYRPMGPNGMPFNPMHQVPPGRGFPLPHPPPGFPQQMSGNITNALFAGPKDIPSQSHSRQPSGSFEKPFEAGTSAPAQPIARPAPIGRPSSVVHGQRYGDRGSHEVEDLSNHLGSSALLDDSDEPLGPGIGARRTSGAPGSIHRQNFPPPPFGMDPSGFASPIMTYGNTWGAPLNPFGGSSLPGAGFWPGSSSFGSMGGSQPIRPAQPRSVAVRLMICRACKNLEGSTSDGYFGINSILEQVDRFQQGEQVSEKELLEICETEGNANNGGGTFDVREDSNGHSVRYHDEVQTSTRPVGAPGDIGSPIIGSGMPRFTGPPPGFN